MMKLENQVIRDRVGAITPPSEAWRVKAQSRLDILTKPIGSLGRLEDLAAQIIAIRQQDLSGTLTKAVFIFAADHGVTVEGVSAYPREVTHQMVLNFLGGGAAINVLARVHAVDLHVIDVGVDADFSDAPGMFHRKVARGTRNMRREPAMDKAELLQAINIGKQVATKAAADGYTFIAVGEMGIGNTTAASVITCLLTGSTAAKTTGRGTGITPEQHAHKVDVVEQTIALHFGARTPDAIEILLAAGGFEIAAMTGMILTAAREHLVVVIDGFISTAAAALAVAIEPDVQGYLIAGHRSEEPGHQLLLGHLQLTPVLSLAMRLGEGSGAVLAMPVLASAVALYAQMATFATAGVSEATA
jgi:nicotinate-nucleotide--dimethylbenzimidazole phosphoribosyltransferase